MRKVISLLLAAVMMVALLSSCKKADTAAEVNGSSAPDWTAYDALIGEIKSTTDMEAREAKMHQAEDMLMETGAVMPLYYYNDLYMQKTGVDGLFANIFGTKYFMYGTKADGETNKLRLCLASEPDHLDPALNSSVDGACLAANSFVGLYTFDKDGNIVPALAAGDPVVSEDGKTYTITMKDGLMWSDGTPLTAKDFEYSWKRAADPNTASDYSYLLVTYNEDGTMDPSASLFADDGTGVINVKASEDGKTLTFVLNSPCPYLMSLLAFPVFMPVPQAAVEAAAGHETNPGAWTAEAGFVSNGAYTLKEWKHNESMVYVKNPNYYDAANVTFDELDFMLSSDDTAMLAAYNAGNLDYIDSVPNDEIGTLKASPEFKVADNLGTYYVGFNVNSDLFKGKTVEQANKMRQAFSYLVDRQAIVDNIGQTNQEVANAFIPSKMSDGHGGEFKVSDAAYTYPAAGNGYYDIAVNVEKAIELLKEAGYEFTEDGMLSESTPITIKYLTNDGTGHIAIAQQMQEDFAQIGIVMEIEQEDWQTFLNDRKEGNFDVAREGWLADYDDPVNMLEMFTSYSGNNDCQLGK
ncbi:MAG: peptide ABC transporter substrate-binding protein [Clostridia bacterium]|nr:peptide ABC transporter substrate-binding protein [Clostridia bacterium]